MHVNQLVTSYGAMQKVDYIIDTVYVGTWIGNVPVNYYRA